MSSPNTHNKLNEKQFEDLFKLHIGYLCNFAKQYVQDADTAQDICQKVFIALWEKRASLNPNLSIKSYLFTAVKNRCLNHIRDHKKYRSKVLDLDCGDFDLNIEASSIKDNDLAAQIEKALSTLPEKCRKVFEMSRYQDMKYREIAEELDISQKTVEAHMSKALKTLRVLLKDCAWMIFFFFIKNQ